LMNGIDQRRFVTRPLVGFEIPLNKNKIRIGLNIW
jgi:hypothetical protein